MRDLDIRRALHRDLQEEFAEDPSTLIVDELGLSRGAARVDVAVVNGHLHGFEIKSERDSLERLPNQEEVYSRIFDYVTIIVGARHLKKVREAVPAWWGIMLAHPIGKSVKLETVRPSSGNGGPDPLSVAELLWRDEALALLEEIGHASGVRSKTRGAICERLAKVLPLAELQERVRATIKARANWRPGR